MVKEEEIFVVEETEVEIVAGVEVERTLPDLFAKFVAKSVIQPISAIIKSIRVTVASLLGHLNCREMLHTRSIILKTICIKSTTTASM